MGGMISCIVLCCIVIYVVCSLTKTHNHYHPCVAYIDNPYDVVGIVEPETAYTIVKFLSEHLDEGKNRYVASIVKKIYELRLEGMRTGVFSLELGKMLKGGGDRLLYDMEVRRRKMLAFAMGTHPRLGGGKCKVYQYLQLVDVMDMILEFVETHFKIEDIDSPDRDWDPRLDAICNY